jgi:hypothetical protein
VNSQHQTGLQALRQSGRGDYGGKSDILGNTHGKKETETRALSPDRAVMACVVALAVLQLRDDVDQLLRWTTVELKPLLATFAAVADGFSTPTGPKENKRSRN